MEEKNRDRVENERIDGAAEGSAEKSSGPESPVPADSVPAKPSGSGRLFLKVLLAAAVLILAGCAYGWYYWNLPEQQLTRVLKSADELLAAKDYEGASSGFMQAMEIDGNDLRAIEGYLTARMEAAAEAEEKAGRDIPARARVCALLEEIIAFCDERAEGTDDAAGTDHTASAGSSQEAASAQSTVSTEDTGTATAVRASAEDTGTVTAIRSSAADKLERLRKEIAEDYESVKCRTEKDDRSGHVILTDGTEIPFTWYYDLVQIDDEYYPLADQINASLQSGKEAFFAGGQTDPSAGISGSGPVEEGEYIDYVGEAGIYSGDGLLSIRMAEIRSSGKARAGFFRGKTFRLSDGKELTLADVTDRTDSGLKHLAKKKIREWFEQEGYTSVPLSEVEDYVDDTDPRNLKFYVAEDGTAFLVIDQEAPFFAAAGEILEIPLN
ncbi:MAG: hypothetical protein Q4C16_10760 [Eubacteriales bacterium]|nr:hypothetical protein [Eubacteriales bacterium]